MSQAAVNPNRNPGPAPRPAAAPRRPRRIDADRVLMRVGWLDPPDRALLEQVYAQHVSTRVLATALGVSTRSVQRRVRRLARRLTDPTVVRLIRRQADWPRPIAQVAIDFYVRGRSLRRIAARRGLTLHQTRRRLEQARALLHTTPAGDVE